jgi:hypothetical protein
MVYYMECGINGEMRTFRKAPFSISNRTNSGQTIYISIAEDILLLGFQKLLAPMPFLPQALQAENQQLASGQCQH